MEDIFLSVIIPAYNEEKRIGNTLSSIQEYFKLKNITYEIIVVNDGSTDSTVGAVEAFQNKDPNLKLINNPINFGKGYAVNCGMNEAKGKYRLFMDADNSVHIDSVENFLTEIREGADIVIGSIAINKAEVTEHNAWHRRIFGTISKFLIRMVAVPGIYDTQRGFKLFTAESATRIFPLQTIWRFGFDIELLVIAETQKMKIKELPVVWDNPSGSKVRLRDYIKTFYELFRIVLNKIRGKYILKSKNITTMENNIACEEDKGIDKSYVAIGGMDSFFEKLAMHALFFGIFLVFILNVGFFMGVTINGFILPVAYILYLLGLLLLNLKLHKKIKLIGIITAIIIIPTVLFLGFLLFAHTYDFTVDGQDYQQTAVISMANGWNPIRGSQLKIPAPVGLYGLGGEFGLPFAIGYPKTLWMIQSSIYKTTGHVNSAVITNLLSALIAFVFLFYLLLRLKISKFWASFIALFSVLEPHFIQQFFSFMSDGFGYEISIVAIVALISLIISKEKTTPLLLFICSWIFLIGTKFSNAYLGLILAVVCLIIIIKYVFFRQKFSKK